jgi:MSHA biogenesis protein MshN
LGAALLLVPLSGVAVALWLPPGVIRMPAVAVSAAPAAPVALAPQPAHGEPSRARPSVPPIDGAIPHPAPRTGTAPAARADAAAPPARASGSPAAGRAAPSPRDEPQRLSLRIDPDLARDRRPGPDAGVVPVAAVPVAAVAPVSSRAGEATAQPGAQVTLSAVTKAAAGTSARSAQASTPLVLAARSPGDPASSSAGAAGAMKRPAGSARDDAQATAGSGVVRKDDLTTVPVRAQRRYRDARDLIARGEIAAARAQLREALALEPGHHDARDLLVALLRRDGEHAHARELLARGLELAPGRAAFATPYARLLVDAGELDRAAAVLADASAAAHGDAEFHALAAAIAQQRGKHDEAITQYTRAIAAQPGEQGRLWLGLGISLAANGDDAQARRALRTAVDSGDLPPQLQAWARSRIE